MHYFSREYTQISARDINEFQYESDDHDQQTSIHIEKYQIGPGMHNAHQETINDLVSTHLSE